VLDFRPYRRPFARTLVTAHGAWSDREGILLRWQAPHAALYSEITPLPWFGSESLEAAIATCQGLSAQLNGKADRLDAKADWLDWIPQDQPATRFGFESLAPEPISLPSPVALSGLLGSGRQALEQWQPLWDQGLRTFKWKIGAGDLAEELALLRSLHAQLPTLAHLRLDANGGLDLAQAQTWLKACDELESDHLESDGLKSDHLKSDHLKIEFLEQPLAPGLLDAMLSLAQRFRTPLALDESVANLDHLRACYAQGWRGIFVIKPAIAGSSGQLRDFCQTHQLDTMFSSVFETRIGQTWGLQLAQSLSRRAVGYGLDHWFEAGDPLSGDDFETIWRGADGP
jgi:o-succinylbenzoate synthase